MCAPFFGIKLKPTSTATEDLTKDPERAEAEKRLLVKAFDRERRFLAYVLLMLALINAIHSTVTRFGRCPVGDHQNREGNLNNEPVGVEAKAGKEEAEGKLYTGSYFGQDGYEKANEEGSCTDRRPNEVDDLIGEPSSCRCLRRWKILEERDRRLGEYLKERFLNPGVSSNDNPHE